MEIYWFIVGAAFGYLVVPAIRRWQMRRKEFSILAKNGLDARKKDEAIAAILSHCRDLKSEEVKTIAITVGTYDEHGGWCAFGGQAGDLAMGINIMCEQLNARCPSIQLDNDGK